MSLSPAGHLVMNHWKDNFPKEAARLEKQGSLEKWAEYAADRWAKVLSDGLARGASYSEAEEVAVQEWGQPPTLNETPPLDPAA